MLGFRSRLGSHSRDTLVRALRSSVAFAAPALLVGCSGSASSPDSATGGAIAAAGGQLGVSGANGGKAGASNGTAGKGAGGATTGSAGASSGSAGESTSAGGTASGAAGAAGGAGKGNAGVGGAASGASDISAPQQLTVPPLAFEDTHITVVWQKPAKGAAASYNVYIDGTRVGSVSKLVHPSGDTNQQLFYDITGLSASSSHTITVRAVDASGGESSDSNAVVQATTAAPLALTITAAPYNAAKDGTTLATAAIQKAINDCSTGGKVIFPAGGKYLAGSLYLKGDCTYQIDGTLVASSKAADYQQGNNRFPSYGSGGKFGAVKYPDNYKALLNTCGSASAADNACVGVKNIRLTGKGTIQGNAALADAEGGANNRGDLVSLTGVNGIYIAGLTLSNSSEHMLFIARSSNITVASINDQSPGILNGDGIDLVTAYADQLTDAGPVGLLPTNAYLFGSVWNNGDDCINLNSGTGAPGVAAATPLDGIHIFDNDTLAGHGGVVYGSYTAAGMKNAWADENTFNGTDVGFRFKTGTGHGGGTATLGAGDIGFLGRDNIGKTAVCLEVTDQYPDTTGMPAAAAAAVFHDITLEGYQCTGMNNLDTGSNIVVNGKTLR